MKHSLLVLAFFGLALSSVVHANSQSHETTECTMCIFQSSNDLDATHSDYQIPAASFGKETLIVELQLVALTKIHAPYFGRAPPFIA